MGHVFFSGFLLCFFGLFTSNLLLRLLPLPREQVHVVGHVDELVTQQRVDPLHLVHIFQRVGNQLGEFIDLRFMPVLKYWMGARILIGGWGRDQRTWAWESGVNGRRRGRQILIRKTIVAQRGRRPTYDWSYGNR